jgi:hypothetical protein
MNARVSCVGLLLITALSLAACQNQYAGTSASIRQTIAVCPTFLPYVATLDGDNFAILPTMSTAQSLALLADGTVDAVLAGRALKPQEQTFPHTVLGEGYSFMASQEISMQETDLHTQNFITNLDPILLQKVFGIRNIQHVDTVYDSLKDHIAITDFDGTDYARAAPVHVLRANGSRLPLSRTPVLYCAQNCPRNLASTLRALLPLSPSSS